MNRDDFFVLADKRSNGENEDLDRSLLENSSLNNTSFSSTRGATTTGLAPIAQDEDLDSCLNEPVGGENGTVLQHFWSGVNNWESISLWGGSVAAASTEVTRASLFVNLGSLGLKSTLKPLRDLRHPEASNQPTKPLREPRHPQASGQPTNLGILRPQTGPRSLCVNFATLF